MIHPCDTRKREKKKQKTFSSKDGDTFWVATNGRYGVPNSLAVGFCFPSFFLSDLVPLGCASLSQAVQVLMFLGIPRDPSGQNFLSLVFLLFFSFFFSVLSFFLFFFKGFETVVDTFPSFSPRRSPERSKARQGKARQGKARQGKARQGKARQGKARQGKARQGKARQGKARQGKARQGKRFFDKIAGGSIH